MPKSRRKTKIAPVQTYRDERRSVLPLCFTAFLQIRPYGALPCPCDVTVAPVVTYSPNRLQYAAPEMYFNQSHSRLAPTDGSLQALLGLLLPDQGFLHIIPRIFAFVKRFFKIFSKKSVFLKKSNQKPSFFFLLTRKPRL